MVSIGAASATAGAAAAGESAIAGAGDIGWTCSSGLPQLTLLGPWMRGFFWGGGVTIPAPAALLLLLELLALLLLELLCGLSFESEAAGAAARALLRSYRR